MSVQVSKNDTGFIKILFLLFMLGATSSLFGCSDRAMKRYDGVQLSEQKILNGAEVTDQNPISKKVLFLATGAKLLKTPSGGSTASQSGQCTASAITNKIILTAAHCVKALDPKDDQTPDSIFIILGLKPWKSKFDPKLWYAAEKIVTYPTYKKNVTGGAPDDLALIVLKNPLPPEYVTELAVVSDLQSTMAFTMAGFGMRSNLNALSDADTKKNLGELFQITKMISNYDINQFTIRIDQHDEKGICSGDSGGPGMIFNPTTKKYSTIGIVSGNSWDIADKDKLDPKNKIDCFGFAIYTNVMNPVYFDWIQKTKQSL